MAFASLVLAACVAVALAPWAGLGASFASVAYYPAPHGGWVTEWTESYDKARSMVAKMTLAEKANLTGGTGVFMGPCSGNTGSVPRLGLPNLCLNDGPNGVRQADHVTAFPDGITVGATFDKQLMYRRGVAIGSEARGKGVHVWLGPSVGPIGRKPKGGRNWEGFGTDPVLQAVGARETVRGVQEQGVIATIKHFVGNEQEMYRMYNPFQFAYSSNIDDRTMHELYMWPFAEAIRAGVGAAMMAYNAVNGSACSQSSYLINGLLKDELGFQGFVMTDWLGHMSGVGSALAGLDMNMPGDPQVPLLGNSYWMYEMSRFILNGSVPMERLNDMATRILAARFKMGQDGDGYPSTNFDCNTHSEHGFLYPAAFPDSPYGVVNHFVPVQADHDVVARQIAQDAITMLKNDAGLLPLSTQASIKVFGTDAQQNPDGPNACRDRNCNKGTLGQGWGSGTVDYPYLDDPITAIKARANKVNFHNSDTFPLILGETPKDDDVAIVFVTSDSGENTYIVEGNHGDRDASGLFLWHGGDKLVQDVAKRYKNVIVVIHTVGPLVVEEWIDLPSVKSVLVAHLPGQEAGRSLAEVLFGDVSPNGHLPYSMTRKEDDMPESVTKLIDREFFNQAQDDYSEGLFIDYRWLNKQHIQPRFAFGHGLSYTNFSYTNGTITKITPMQQFPPVRPEKGPTLDYSQAIPSASEVLAPSGFRRYWRYIYPWLSESDANAAIQDAKTRKYPYPEGYKTQPAASPRSGGAQGGNPALWDVAYEVSITVTNTGARNGKASVQAYIEHPKGIAYETPVIQLRDFEKTAVLAPGESARIKLRLTRKDLSVWDVVNQDWMVPDPNGEYKIWLGAASNDLTAACRTGSMVCQHGIKGPV